MRAKLAGKQLALLVRLTARLAPWLMHGRCCEAHFGKQFIEVQHLPDTGKRLIDCRTAAGLDSRGYRFPLGLSSARSCWTGMFSASEMSASSSGLKPRLPLSALEVSEGRGRWLLPARVESSRRIAYPAGCVPRVSPS